MYQQIEELRSRGGEKVALFLSAANVGGIIIAVLPVFLLTTNTPLLLRAITIILTAVVGYSVTLDVGGLALYERMLWVVRGAVRRRMNGDSITPDMLTGVLVRVPSDQPITIGGPITIVRSPQHSRGRTP